MILGGETEVGGKSPLSQGSVWNPAHTHTTHTHTYTHTHTHTHIHTHTHPHTHTHIHTPTYPHPHTPTHTHTRAHTYTHTHATHTHTHPCTANLPAVCQPDIILRTTTSCFLLPSNPWRSRGGLAWEKSVLDRLDQKSDWSGKAEWQRSLHPGSHSC